MMLLNLYFTFVKVGMFAFGGGYATIPLIREFVVFGTGWITSTEFTDVIAISQMTPGPIAINAATFVGIKTFGGLGALAATLGVITPQSLLMFSLAPKLFQGERRPKVLDRFLQGVKPVVVALIFSAALTLIRENLFLPDSLTPQPLAWLTFLLGIVLMVKKTDPVKIIVLSGVLGLLFSGGLR